MTEDRLSVRRPSRPSRKVTAFGRYAAPLIGWVDHFEGLPPESQAKRKARIDGLFKRHGIERFDVVSDTANRLYKAAYPILSPLQRELSDRLLLRGYDLAEVRGMLGFGRDVIGSELTVIFSVLKRVLRGMDIVESVVISDDLDKEKETKKKEIVMSNDGGKGRKNFPSDLHEGFLEDWNTRMKGREKFTDADATWMNRHYPEYVADRTTWINRYRRISSAKENKGKPVSVEMAKVLDFVRGVGFKVDDLVAELGLTPTSHLGSMSAGYIAWSVDFVRQIADFAHEHGYTRSPVIRDFLGETSEECVKEVVSEESDSQRSLSLSPRPTALHRRSEQQVFFLVVGNEYAVHVHGSQVCKRAVFLGYNDAANAMVFEGEKGEFAVCRNSYGIIGKAKQEVAGG